MGAGQDLEEQVRREQAGELAGKWFGKGELNKGGKGKTRREKLKYSICRPARCWRPGGGKR